MRGKTFVNGQELPSRLFAGAASAWHLPDAHEAVAMSRKADGMNLDGPEKAVIAKL
jgi:hypothetical protein